MLQINGVLLISEGEILKSFWSFDVMPSSVIPERTTDLKKKTKENKSDILTESCNLETDRKCYLRWQPTETPKDRVDMKFCRLIIRLRNDNVMKSDRTHSGQLDRILHVSLSKPSLFSIGVYFSSHSWNSHVSRLLAKVEKRPCCFFYF